MEKRPPIRSVALALRPEPYRHLHTQFRFESLGPNRFRFCPLAGRDGVGAGFGLDGGAAAKFKIQPMGTRWKHGGLGC